MSALRGDDLPDRIGDLLSRLRDRRPLVHLMTNLVTMRDVADATLALGALPVMALAGEEVEEIASASQALVLNLGTPTEERVEAMIRAGRAAGAAGVPIIVDPVGAGASAFRLANARRALGDLRVAIVRANPGEAAAILGAEGTMRGVESHGPSRPGDELAAVLAQTTGAVAAVTGARDHVSDGRRHVSVENGDPMLARISGGGDLATAIIAAFAAIEQDALLAATAGLAATGVAAEIAAQGAGGPGTFKVAVIDALAALSPQHLAGSARISVRDAAWT
ncbi:MAG: hydroxyethylthiazole kinase [Armatimonadota bacterium]